MQKSSGTGAAAGAAAGDDQDDKNFDPTAEALIDEIDDERTLEEEEGIAGNNEQAVQEEIDDLKRESEMPLEDLLAYYQRMRESEGACGDEEDELDDEDEDMEDEDDEDFEDDDEEDEEEKGGIGSVVDDKRQVPTTTTQLEPVSGSKQQDSSASSSCNSSRPPANPSKTNFLLENYMHRSMLDYNLDDSEDEDYSYTDDETFHDERDWRRSINVGPDYQADVPEGLSEYSDLPPYQLQDTLLWKCNSTISDQQLLGYLRKAASLSQKNFYSVTPNSVPKISKEVLKLYRERMQDQMTPATPAKEPIEAQVQHQANSARTPHSFTMPNDVYMSQSRKRAKIDFELEQENATDGMTRTNVQTTIVTDQIITSGSEKDNSDSTSQDTKPELLTDDFFHDEEQLLYLLLSCNWNIDEAIRRRTLYPFKFFFNDPMSLWSEEECLSFEDGLRAFGKNFRLIRENKVPTRTHAELVAFYYLWKKSERHDVYTNRYKLDKKRCLSHPGTTDYMDKFIEDNESALNASSSSSSSTSSTPAPQFNNSNPQFQQLCTYDMMKPPAW